MNLPSGVERCARQDDTNGHDHAAQHTPAIVAYLLRVTRHTALAKSSAMISAPFRATVTPTGRPRVFLLSRGAHWIRGRDDFA